MLQHQGPGQCVDNHQETSVCKGLQVTRAGAQHPLASASAWTQGAHKTLARGSPDCYEFKAQTSRNICLHLAFHRGVQIFGEVTASSGSTSRLFPSSTHTQGVAAGAHLYPSWNEFAGGKVGGLVGAECSRLLSALLWITCPYGGLRTHPVHVYARAHAHTRWC